MTNATAIKTKKDDRDLGALMAALATMVAIVALLSLSAHASAKQGGDLRRSASGSTMKEAALATTSSTSTTPKASFASGSGANFLGVKVSDDGNLMSFESPKGQEQVFDGREGYALCSNASTDGTVSGHDTGSVESGFGPATFSQPTAGKFPLTITRKTTDGTFKLTQVWNQPDPLEKDVTVSMSVTNLSGKSIDSILLSRSGDFDVGNTGSDQGARTADSAWQWNDVDSTTDTPPVGLMLGALSLGTEHEALIESRSDWTDESRQGCFGPGQGTPTASQDLAMRVIYGFGGLNSGQSKTVKFQYGRM